MNMNVIINMVIRQLVRRVVNFGVGAGINAASKIGKSAPSAGSSSATPPNVGADAKRVTKQARLAQRGPWK